MSLNLATILREAARRRLLDVSSAAGLEDLAFAETQGRRLEYQLEVWAVPAPPPRSFESGFAVPGWHQSS